MFTDYLNKITDWLSHLDYSSLGWELLVLALAVAGALLVHRTLGRFLLDTSSELDASHIKRITLRSAQRIVFPLSMLLVALVWSGWRVLKIENTLHGVMLDLAHQVVKDGEGATKFVEIAVEGAASDAGASKRAPRPAPHLRLVKPAQ